MNLGVWRSTNNGNNLNQVSDGIFYPFIDALCFDSAGYTYAGSLGGGLYKSTFVISVKNEQKNIPKSFTLYQNYPNPFNPTTKIKFSIPARDRGQTILSVYDILGREVAILVNEKLSPGEGRIKLNGMQVIIRAGYIFIN